MELTHCISQEQLAQVQEKLRKAKITIGDLEKVAEFGTSKTQRYDDPLLNKLTDDKFNVGVKL